MFEVLKNDKVKMRTADESAIPPLAVLWDMKERGYTFKKDGKVYKLPAKRKKKGDDD